MIYLQTQGHLRIEFKRYRVKLNLSETSLEVFVKSILKNYFGFKNPSVQYEDHLLYESGEGLENSEIRIYEVNKMISLRNLGLKNLKIMICIDFDTDRKIEIEVLDLPISSFEVVVCGEQSEVLNALIVSAEKSNEISHQNPLKRKIHISPERSLKVRKYT